MDWKSFVIGSSWIVFVHFFLAVQKLEKVKNYEYTDYTIIAPLYLGLMNVLGGHLFDKMGSMNRYAFTGIMSGLIVAIFGRIYGSYNYNESEWNQYYGYILTKHFVTFFVIIQLLTQLVG